MKTNYINCMQLFGNCSALFYLGSNRIRGPVDNIACKNVEVVNLLLKNKFLEEIYSKRYTAYKQDINKLDTDPNYFYEFDSFKVYHNDIHKIKFKIEIKKRIDAFNAFYEKVKTTDKNYYFTVTYNAELHNNPQEILKIIEILKQNDLIKKTIFVDIINCSAKSFERTSLENLYSDFFKKLALQNNIKHIRLNYMTTLSDLAEQFQTKLKLIS